ncbi:hypothetical protein [Myceligenerans indicum]|uniref:Uncharacterized protein n=1 Tax=Myceligenerans indicum TaxID=2593663 RepID=A0ABS1LRT4_9MICO|nr:hypothetical protein [Myceligenerans indicum]MBL0888498.1 hypothetical protein [Myceligenerans indicum]
MSRPRAFLASLGLLMLTLVVANTPLLPVSAPSIASAAGGVGILDLQPQTTAEAVYAALTAYGPSGRTTYLWELATVDLVLPLAMALTQVLAMRLMLRRMAPPGSRWHLLAWLPFIPSILDYVENLGIGTVLLAYPNRVGWVAEALAPLTATKSACYVGSLVLVIATLLAMGARRLGLRLKGRSAGTAAEAQAGQLRRPVT